jgi:hypothetical protein
LLSNSFACLFRGLALGVSLLPVASCGGDEVCSSSSSPWQRPSVTTTKSLQVDVRQLQAALEDEVATPEECVAVCGAEFDDPSCSYTFDGARFYELTRGLDVSSGGAPSLGGTSFGGASLGGASLGGASWGGASQSGGATGDRATGGAPLDSAQAHLTVLCLKTTGGGLHYCR